MLNCVEKNEIVFIYVVLLTLEATKVVGVCTSLTFTIPYTVTLATGTSGNGQEVLSSKTSYHPLAVQILTKIKDDNWREDETPCYNDITRLLESARNHTLWATWVLDSMQLPVGALYGSRYHLGNYDQCLDERWSSSNPELETQYCLVDVTSQELPPRKFDPYDDAEAFVKSKSIYGRRHFLNSFGVCLPASCSPQAVEKLSIHIINASHMPYGDVSVDPRNCQRAMSKQMAYSFGYYVFWFIITTLIAAVATVYVVEDYITNPKLSEIAAWFSPSKNLRSLIDTRANEVKPLHGIRFISCGTMVVMHYIYVVSTLTVINQACIGKDADTVLGRPLAHLDILTNSFSVLTGFLFMRGHYYRDILKPVEVLYKRYQRFIALYAMVIFYIVSVSPHTGSGPLWPRYLKLEHEPCVRSWWSGLLMMFDTSDICYIPTWYISCDFQLSILGLIILWCWKKDQRKGLMLFSAALIASIVLPAILTYWHKLSPFLLYDMDIALDITHNQVYQKVYSKTYSNASSYLIGFGTGYIFSVYKPEQNKNVFSKATSIIISLTLGYIVITMMNGIGSLLFKEYDSSNAWYAGIDEVVWSIALCGLIVICEYGTLPVVTDFLGSKLFVACSRLSYSVYLIHMVMIYRNLFSLRAPLTYDMVHLIINSIGYMTASFMLSYLLWFIIEAPASNMFNYFKKNRPKHEKTKQQRKDFPVFEELNGKQK